MWYWTEEALHLQVKWRWQFVPDEWRTAGHVCTFGFVLMPKNVKIKRERIPTKSMTNSLSYLQQLLSPLHYTALPFVKAKTSKVKWPVNLRHYNSPLFLCYWSLKQELTGLRCNNDSLSIQYTNADKQCDGYTKHSQWSPKVNVTKNTCGDLGQVFWHISWSSIFISSDVKSITLRRKHRHMFRTMTNTEAPIF